jgi:hypothetical protein
MDVLTRSTVARILPPGSRSAVTRTLSILFGFGGILVSVGCVPDVDVDEALVSGPRLLAVAFDPPEAKPGESVTARALFVTTDGPVTASALALPKPDLVWAQCVARRPLTELRPVSGECIAADPDALSPAGSGIEISTALPAESCQLFGPDLPPVSEGSVGARPVDADVTGGYYFPLLARFGLGGAAPSLALSQVRLSCGLPNARREDAARFNARALPNANPRISRLELNGRRVTRRTRTGEPLTVKAGARFEVVATWPECPASATCGDGVCQLDETDESCPADCDATTRDGAPVVYPAACAGAEPYLVLDPIGRELVVRRESMRVAWYATGGTFAFERTGRAESEAVRTSANTWTAPSVPGRHYLWVVLRDARGGTGWVQLTVDVAATG